MPVDLWWDDEDAAHIRSRSLRYPGSIVRDPDPKSRVAYVRLIGYSKTAGFVVTVIIDPEDASGVTAWKTRGADLREYLDRKEQRHG